MDGAAEGAAALVREDGAGKKPPDGVAACEDSMCPATMDTAEGVGVFCCRDCGEGFREEAAYMEHCHQHLQESMYLDKETDGFHVAEKDREQNAGRTNQHTFECPDCGKCYEVFGHFLNHQRSHRQASKSVFHDLEHLKKKSFQCESCGRSYSRASALDAHRRCHEEKLVKARNRSSGDAFHTEESTVEAKPPETKTDSSPTKLFECSCGKAFTALMRLKTHQRFSRNSQCSPEEMREKQKKICGEFQCSECNKTFSSYIALFNHQRWHSKFSNDSENKFPCELCGKVFMTLTFYYRHQRTAHSDETPSKSFLHQVCQLQKKAFECKDCGLKFSRASALHSHQLHHTDSFRETEAGGQTSLPPQPSTLESERKDTEQEQGQPEDVLSTCMAEKESHANEIDEDIECYGPGDFNVQVISASESEDESAQDPNPDLELLCESDQEQRDYCDTGAFPSKMLSKPEMDLKIVQIDFEPADMQCASIESEPVNNLTGQRFDCPDCYRWFNSASSLRVHRMWHGIRKRRHQVQGQSEAVHTCDICGHEASSFAAHSCHITQHKNQNTNSDEIYQTKGLEKKNLTCNECGKCFSRLSALVSHQLHHPKRKQFQCPDCMMSYSYAASLFNHMKNCSAQKRENFSVTTKEYNPKKTLLGPKIYHCEQCGKGFWSLGAYSHHKQNQSHCVDLRLRKGVIGSLHVVNGHPRSTVKVACPVCGRKFRHKGIMALHMRKHENGNHKCELCNRSFRLFSSLLRHQVVHNDQLLPPPIKSFQHQVEQLKKNTYSCPDCGKLFSRAKALQFHMKSHGYETCHSPSSPRSSVSLEDLQCATCLSHFNNKASLRAHQKLCIKRDREAVDCKVEPSENDVTKLPNCSMGFSTQQTFEQITDREVKNEMNDEEQQMRNETGVGNLKHFKTTNLKYKCKKCDRSFSVIGALNFHKRIHVEGYKPEIKSKLSMSVMLKKSKQEDSTKGLFHCPECGRRFMSNSALGSHKRWHKEKKLSRSLPKDDDLKSIGNKTEGGPFHCNKCGKQFFNHCVLQRHQVFNPQCQTKPEPEPNLDNRSAMKTSKFPCPECKNTFTQHSLLAAHCENEHGKTLTAVHLQGDHLSLVEQVQDQVDVSVKKSVSELSNVKQRVHQCPLCPLVFSKARGLRAHRWQVHSKSAQSKNNVILNIKKPAVFSGEVKETEDSSENATVTAGTNPNRTVEKKTCLDPSPVKSVSCLNTVKSGPAGTLLDHKKMGLEVKHGSKQEIQTPDTTTDISSPVSRVSEHTAKCLFKCDKCGKAFPTEEQLGSHKTKAKSRPYCCALCCQGFWTENQLQQHLAWHDEVRCRLPNEVRYRLSAALTSKPLKPIMPSADTKGKSSPTKADRLLQNNHKCQHCGKAFLSPTVLQKHEAQHCNNDSYHCSICPRTFSEIQDLINHHQECIGDYKRQSDAPAAASSGDATSLFCLECGTTFCQETDLHQHNTEHAR